MGVKKKGTELSRAERKSKKRKLEDAIPDLPGENETGENESGTQQHVTKRKKASDGTNAVGGGSNVVDTGREAVISEKETGRNHNGDFVKAVENSRRGPDNNTDNGESPTLGEPLKVEDIPRKSKKERKAEKKAKQAAAAEKSLHSRPTSSIHGDANIAENKLSKKNNRNREKDRESVTEKTNTNTANSEAAERKHARFIVFIGNLPFSATTESIRKHFTAVKPISVRHLTQKDNPTKSRGCAFLEFQGYDHMKTCLKLFHHSMFDDGISASRKINVELTAGGGGNTKDRRTKIDVKNQKLNEQRVRGIQEKSKSERKVTDHSSIHPSRRDLVRGA